MRMKKNWDFNSSIINRAFYSAKFPHLSNAIAHLSSSYNHFHLKHVARWNGWLYQMLEHFLFIQSLNKGSFPFLSIYFLLISIHEPIPIHTDSFHKFGSLAFFKLASTFELTWKILNLQTSNFSYFSYYIFWF